MFRRFMSSITLLALFAVPAFAAAPAQAVDTRDQLIADRIGEKINGYVYYTIFDDVQGRVENGLVTLTGKVTAPHKAKSIAQVVKRIPGVREVDNQIETLPVSTFDDQLRYEIASNIYRDMMFSNYAMQVNPPIHVIVDRGHVTLVGVVNSEVERRVAEFKARDAFGSFSVANKLVLERDLQSSN
jgi:hyperosmotically inducible protein